MPFSHIVCVILVTALWGANYAVVQIGMETFPPLLYNAVRFVLVAAILLPFSPVPTRAQLRQIAALSLTLCVGHMGLIFMALYHGLNSAGSALIMQLGVPFSCILCAILLNDRIGVWRMAGLALSGAGTLVILGDPNVMQYPAACAMAVVSAFFWAVTNIQIKRMSGVNMKSLLAWQAVFAVPVLFALSLGFETIDWQKVFAPPLASVSALAYTTLLSSITAFGLWNWLIRKHEVSRIAPFALLMPFFAAASGQFLLDERLSHALITGGLLMLMGVAIITVRRPKLQALGEPI